MRGSTPGCSPTGSTVIILDTPAFITGKAAQIQGAAVVSTPRVLEEVRDSGSRWILELLEASGRLTVLEPKPAYLERAERAAWKAGVLGRLSKADLEVLAVAIMSLDYGCRVSVATDDYALQRAARALGIGVVSLRYRPAP